MLRAFPSASACLFWRPRGRSKSVLGRVMLGVTPFRALIYLLIVSPKKLETGLRTNSAGIPYI